MVQAAAETEHLNSFYQDLFARSTRHFDAPGKCRSRQLLHLSHALYAAGYKYGHWTACLCDLLLSIHVVFFRNLLDVTSFKPISHWFGKVCIINVV